MAATITAVNITDPPACSHTSRSRVPSRLRSQRTSSGSTPLAHPPASRSLVRSASCGDGGGQHGKPGRVRLRGGLLSLGLLPHFETARDLDIDDGADEGSKW